MSEAVKRSATARKAAASRKRVAQARAAIGAGPTEGRIHSLVEVIERLAGHGVTAEPLPLPKHLREEL